MNRVNQIDTSLLILAYEISQQNPSIVLGQFNNIESLKLPNPATNHHIDYFVNKLNRQPVKYRIKLIQLLSGDTSININDPLYRLYIALKAKYPASPIQTVFDIFHK